MITNEELLKFIQSGESATDWYFKAFSFKTNPRSPNVSTYQSNGTAGGYVYAGGCASTYIQNTFDRTGRCITLPTSLLALSLEQTLRIIKLINAEFYGYEITVDVIDDALNKVQLIKITYPKFPTYTYKCTYLHFLRALLTPEYINFWKWFFFIESALLPKLKFTECWILAMQCSGYSISNLVFPGYICTKNYNNGEFYLSNRVNKKLNKVLLDELSTPEHGSRVNATIVEYYSNNKRRDLSTNFVVVDGKTKIFDLITAFVKNQRYRGKCRIRKAKVRKLPTI